MNANDKTQFTRRTFLGCCSCLAATAGLVAADELPVEKQPETTLYDPLSVDEEEAIGCSEMARGILETKGCSCAESVLLAALRYLKQPEKMLHSAAGFGGGMGQRDLCGLLTGGFMALGNAAGVHHEDRGKMKARARQMTKEYWKWWSDLAPVHCHELQPNYDKDGYVNMKKRVAAKIEELIKEDLETIEQEKELS
jgi:C_GCAxxG_C_C family probable redox protein